MRRFRPIVLTAAAAILAMIPLTRSDFFGPMAVAMMGGIVVATLLTLVLPAGAVRAVVPRAQGTDVRARWRPSERRPRSDAASSPAKAGTQCLSASSVLARYNRSSPDGRTMTLATTPEIVAELKAGRIVVLVDDEDRENEGDLVFAADFVTPEKINFLAKHGRGLDLHADHAGARRAPQARADDAAQPLGARHQLHRVDRGGARASRPASRPPIARTRSASPSRPDAKPDDIVQPGHVFPLIAQPGGVLVRAGHTEACCDLARLAGLTPAAVLCEIMNDDGTMARLPDLERLRASSTACMIGTIADLIHHRSRTERLVERIAERPLATPHGAFRLVVYRDKLSDATHLALVRGPISPDTETLVRVHEPLSVMDLLDAQSDAHSWSIPAALATIAEAGRGVVVLLHRPEIARRSCAAARSPKRRRRRRRWTCATTASARRSCATSTSAACACSRGRARCRAWRASTSR